jgi:hypothetical protein
MSQFVGFADDEYKKLMAGFQRLGGDLKEVLVKVVEDGAQMVQNKAREKHFFIGTKRMSREEEEAATYEFTNPDGTPRFKIRTANLVNAIQARDAEVKGDTVASSVVAGMEYAKKVEEGAPGRRAFPYMRPAFEESKAPIIDRAKDILKDRIAKWKP